jgi:hypothetical protein
LSRKKKKSILNKEKIDKPKIRPDQDALSAKWGMVSAIAACITAFLSASVIVYTIVQYIQISK